jgi:putative tryptophan/tyrosine transport system substrate-binding protein
MRRRDFMTLVGGAAIVWPLAAAGWPAAGAQQGKVARIGVLMGGTQAATKDRNACFDKGLRDLGWIEGQNIVIERRWYESSVARAPALAAELIRLHPDLIFTAGTDSAQAVQHATKDIPVVFSMVSDPVATGIVPNLAHPDANITGISNFFPAMIGKLLDLIITTSGAKQIAVLHDPDNPGKQVDLRYLQESARAVQVSIKPVPLHNTDDVNAAFVAMAKTLPDAVIVLVDAVTISNMELIVRRVAELTLPAIYQERTFVELGGLMSYALNYCDHFQRAATYVDKILKGEKPSALPVEQPATFQFVINRKAARAIGLTLPQTILAFADDVIE